MADKGHKPTGGGVSTPKKTPPNTKPGKLGGSFTPKGAGSASRGKGQK